PETPNPDQMDSDGDGFGDACDPLESEFWLEAECAVVGSEWTFETSVDASNGEYVVRKFISSTSVIPDDIPANIVRFDLSDVAAAGYHIFGRIAGKKRTNDSYWFRVNGGPWIYWTDIITNDAFNWNKAVGGAYPLNEGDNVIEIIWREKGTKLDKLYLSQNASLPTEIGPVAENCGSTAKAIVTNTETKLNTSLNRKPLSPEAEETRLVLYPNPTGDLLNVRLQSPYSGQVKVMLLDMNGRLLRTIDYDKQAGELGTRLRVNTLVPGTYQLRVIQGDRQTIKPFVKLP
ncbi:MAG: T9SS type A sorting domain-containing protein, partial [Bacteroidota bacterium]